MKDECVSMRKILTIIAIASLTNGCIYLKVKENKANCARYETQRAEIEDKFQRWWRASDEYKEEWNSDKRYLYMKEGGFSNLSASAWKQDEQRAYEENRETYRSTSPEWQDVQKKYKRLFMTDNPTEYCNYLKEKETGKANQIINNKATKRLAIDTNHIHAS